jgi:hypothetical protein
MRPLNAAVLAGAALLVASAASATNTCVQSARQTYNDCKQSCQDDFTAAQLTCRNIEPACGEACLEGLSTCTASVEQILDTGQLPGGTTSLANCADGLNGCDAALQQARQACWAQYCASGQTCTSCAQTTDQVSCWDCIDPAQLTAFSCRDACRDSFRLDLTVQAMKNLCKSTFNACKKQCPPPPTPAS